MYSVIHDVWTSRWTHIANRMTDDINTQVWNTLDAARDQLTRQSIQDHLHENT